MLFMHIGFMEMKSSNLKLFNFNNHSVDLYINEKLIEKGNSKNVMENPINSLTWLINKLALLKVRLCQKIITLVLALVQKQFLFLKAIV